jgi:hypothetical protein
MPRKARSLLCYWAVRKLGFSATELSKKLGVSQPSVSISVKRGEKIAKTGQLELVEDYKVIILWDVPNTLWVVIFSKTFQAQCMLNLIAH